VQPDCSSRLWSRHRKRRRSRIPRAPIRVPIKHAQTSVVVEQPSLVGQDRQLDAVPESQLR
jgi:hypothetical protein